MELAAPSYSLPSFTPFSPPQHSFTPNFLHNRSSGASQVPVDGGEGFPPIPQNIKFSPFVQKKQSYNPAPPISIKQEKTQNVILKPTFTAQNLLPQQEPMLYMKGYHVPLSDKGYKLLVRWGSIDDMVVFVRRVVNDLGMRDIENDSIIEVAEKYMDRPQNFDSLVADLRSGSGIQRKRKSSKTYDDMERKVRFTEDDASTDSVQVDEFIIPSGKLDKSELSNALLAIGWQIAQVKFSKIVDEMQATAHVCWVRLIKGDGEVYESQAMGWDATLALKQIVYDICRHCKLEPEYEQFIENKENMGLVDR